MNQVDLDRFMAENHLAALELEIKNHPFNSIITLGGDHPDIDVYPDLSYQKRMLQKKAYDLWRNDESQSNEEESDYRGYF